MAERWGDVFIEADELHSANNVRKMALGIPLDDNDRLPWLREVGERLRDEAEADRRSVTACSALTRSYRDVLREYVPSPFFVELDGPLDVVRERVLSRHHEFMSVSLLESQFTTLQPLETDELGLRVDVTLDVDEIVDVVERALAAQSSL
jgi:carbohydrate kinase (thermoresistant glucokinase family)